MIPKPEMERDYVQMLWATALTDLLSEVIVYPFLSKQNIKILEFRVDSSSQVAADSGVREEIPELTFVKIPKTKGPCSRYYIPIDNFDSSSVYKGNFFPTLSPTDEL